MDKPGNGVLSGQILCGGWPGSHAGLWCGKPCRSVDREEMLVYWCGRCLAYLPDKHRKGLRSALADDLDYYRT